MSAQLLDPYHVPSKIVRMTINDEIPMIKLHLHELFDEVGSALVVKCVK